MDLDNDQDDKKPAGRVTMDDRDLIAILSAEEVDASSYYTSELAKEQAEALDRYFAKPYGDEVEGRSKVCTHDVEDTINWVMPDLMRVFLQSDDLVTVHDDTNASDQAGIDLEDVAELWVGDWRPASGDQVEASITADPWLTDVKTLRFGRFAHVTDPEGNRVELRGFGAFSVKSRTARTGRNPRTGTAVAVDAKRVPYFKTGKELRERLNGKATA